MSTSKASVELLVSIFYFSTDWISVVLSYSLSIGRNSCMCLLQGSLQLNRAIGQSKTYEARCDQCCNFYKLPHELRLLTNWKNSNSKKSSSLNLVFSPLCDSDCWLVCFLYALDWVLWDQNWGSNLLGTRKVCVACGEWTLNLWIPSYLLKALLF